MMVSEFAAGIAPRPHGHVDNLVAPRLRALAGSMTMDELRELNGLVGRAHFLIENPPFTPETPPDGGSAAPMAMRMAA